MKVTVPIFVGFKRCFVTSRVIELWCTKCNKVVARSPHNTVLTMMERAHVCSGKSSLFMAATAVASITTQLGI